MKLLWQHVVVILLHSNMHDLTVMPDLTVMSDLTVMPGLTVMPDHNSYVWSNNSAGYNN